MANIDVTKFKNINKFINGNSTLKDQNINKVNKVQPKQVYADLRLDLSKITENEDGTINYNGDVIISGMSLDEIPVKFKEVTGDFDCSKNSIDILTGSPEIVKGNFNCSYNNLDDLYDAPTSVGGSFNCSYNNIDIMVGTPPSVNDLDISYNKLITLDGIPKDIKGSLYLNNNDLISLEFCPDQINGNFIVCHNKLNILRFGPRIVGSPLNADNTNVRYVFDCSHNNLLNLNDAPKQTHGDFICSNNNYLFKKSDVKRASDVKGEIIT